MDKNKKDAALVIEATDKALCAAADIHGEIKSGSFRFITVRSADGAPCRVCNATVTVTTRTYGSASERFNSGKE